MDRVIFCPNESMLPEATRLSQLHLAPIQIGESERTRHLDFDKSAPIPVLIPVFHYLRITPEPPIVGVVHHVEYINEFRSLPKNVRVEMLNHSVGDPNGWFIPPGIVWSKHKVSFFHMFSEAETFTVYIKIDDETLDSFTYSVVQED